MDGLFFSSDPLFDKSVSGHTSQAITLANGGASFTFTKQADEVTELPDPWCTVPALVVLKLMVTLMPSCLAALVSEGRCLATVAKSVRHVVPTVLTDPQHAPAGVLEAVNRAERYALEIALGFQSIRRPPDARF